MFSAVLQRGKNRHVAASDAFQIDFIARTFFHSENKCRTGNIFEAGVLHPKFIRPIRFNLNRRRNISELRAEGVRVGKERVQQLTQQHGIRARGKRRFRITTTDSRHGLPIAPNLLDRNFTVAKPNQVWVADLTYIATDEGWLFLAVVMDLFNRQVVGWSLGEDMRCELVIDAFEMAWCRRCPGRKTGLIFHSDRGSQYASQQFQE